MLRYLVSIGNIAEIEAGGIIVAHGSLIIRPVLIHQTYLLDWIAIHIQPGKNVQQIMDYIDIAYNFPESGCSLQILIKKPQISQILQGKYTVVLIGFATYPVIYLIVYLTDAKSLN